MGTMGNTLISGTSSVDSQNTALVCLKVVAPEDGSLQSMTFRTYNASAPLTRGTRLGLYSSNGIRPITKLAETPAFDRFFPNKVYVQFTESLLVPYAIVQGTEYWLCYNTESSWNDILYSNLTGSRARFRYQTNYFTGGLPATFPSAPPFAYTTGSELLEIFGTYAPATNPYPKAFLKRLFISGYHCFMNGYIRAKIEGFDPLKLPDGTVV